MNSKPESASRWDAIERQARFLQLKLWNDRSTLWPSNTPVNPQSVLQPGVALKTLGYSIHLEPSLGQIILSGRSVAVAGLVDRRMRQVKLSSGFRPAERNFTAAHELGHVILHPNGELLHRDRPLCPETYDKPLEELEADWFATCFLMPRKLVVAQFRTSFMTDKFNLDDDTAFALCASSADKLARHIRSHRDLSALLAKATSYAGRQVRALHQVFGVSVTAMAYRLEQLQLVEEPNLRWLHA